VFQVGALIGFIFLGIASFKVGFFICVVSLFFWGVVHYDLFWEYSERQIKCTPKQVS
jgi:hypothetical protein